MRANGLFEGGSDIDYAHPTDKLLAQQSETKNAEQKSQAPQKVSRLNLPTKDALLSDVQAALQQLSILAILVIDLDHFKSVNDKLGHSEGDACLDRVVDTIAIVVGRKGKLHRWGSGDEFAVFLPDFSTEDAQATAERIRSSVEQNRPGGEILVTTSIGICGTDRADSKQPVEILDFADKAMYESKQSGRNRVTAWPITAAKT